MQGDKVEEGIITALDAIAQDIDFWDVVVIIRGGGATSDLSCFDTYDLANNCAQFPLPIITGIGHQRDDTVLDAVAHTRVKTPTAAADLLIHALAEQAAIVKSAQNILAQQRIFLKGVLQRLPVATELLLQHHRHKLDLWQQLAESSSPQRILSLGYSLTTCNGRVVRSADDVKEGDRLVTHLGDGEVSSKVE